VADTLLGSKSMLVKECHHLLFAIDHGQEVHSQVNINNR
jgi:hypothetical protein